MNDGKISVIVPVYKVEPYLDRCVASIVNQTYTNLEIILVDDGSPDNCPAMCDAWAAKDSRIRVIHKENGGGGAARNTGIDLAHGEFIAFVDSDDYIAPDMYAYLISLMTDCVDIAECDYTEAFDDNMTFTQSSKATKFSAHDAMMEHIHDHFFRQVIWNKLYRRNVVEGVRFPEHTVIDDEFFTYQVLGNARTLMHSPSICYAYRQQPNSVMHLMGFKKRLQAVEAKEERHRFIENKFPTLIGESMKSIWFTSIYHGQQSLRYLHGEDRKACLRYLSACLHRHPYPKADLKECTAKEKIWLTMAQISFLFTCLVRNFLGIGT